MTEYALFKHGQPCSKWHSTKDAVVVEAYERGAILSFRRDVCLASEYSIDERETAYPQNVVDSLEVKKV